MNSPSNFNPPRPTPVASIGSPAVLADLRSDHAGKAGQSPPFPIHLSPEIFMSTTRRTFLATIATTTAGISLAARAQTTVDEKDPQAAALGYATDGTRVDAKKYPKYAAGQACSSCALYQGKAGDAGGLCPLFAGKQVSAKGWCSAWAKKA